LKSCDCSQSSANASSRHQSSGDAASFPFELGNHFHDFCESGCFPDHFAFELASKQSGQRDFSIDASVDPAIVALPDGEISSAMVFHEGKRSHDSLQTNSFQTQVELVTDRVRTNSRGLSLLVDSWFYFVKMA
jgi:hypothetical protein